MAFLNIFVLLVAASLGCTPDGQDPYVSGHFVECCQGLKKCLKASTGWSYRCQSCNLSCPDDKDYPGRPCNGPSPAPGPTPKPGPTPTPRPGQKRGTFFVLGDWGYNSGVHGSVTSRCQKLIGEAMQKKFRDEKNKGSDVLFVLNMGDSFYPSGISSNSGRWRSNWVDVYGSALTDLPWFGVYGNHDYEGTDRCACNYDTSGCAQINKRYGGWYMPAPSYYVTSYQEKWGIEIIALDTNHVDAAATCKWAKCSNCYNVLSDRIKKAMTLFNERVEKTTAKNLLVFSHYPTDYFGGYPDFLKKLRDNRRHTINYFGGHRHNVDQGGTSISPNKHWLVGGGGGWGCDGRSQGFVVGHIETDGSITTYSQLVDAHQCCSNYVVDADIPPSASCYAYSACKRHADNYVADCCPNNDGKFLPCCFVDEASPFRNATLMGLASKKPRFVRPAEYFNLTDAATKLAQTV